MNNVLDAVSDFQKKTGCRIMEIRQHIGAGSIMSVFELSGQSARGDFFEVKSKFPNKRLETD